MTSEFLLSSYKYRSCLINLFRNGAGVNCRRTMPLHFALKVRGVTERPSSILMYKGFAYNSVCLILTTSL